MITVAHNRIELALHPLRPEPSDAETGGSEGQRRLLVLHGLGERSDGPPPGTDGWPGPVWGLDFTGHGASTVPAGGGYTCEILAADVDAALARLGACTVLGRGLGGYIGLLAAGSRPAMVRGVVIDDGPGLSGGGDRPGSIAVSVPDPSPAGAAPDPFALAELSRDVRPRDYATSFVRLAVQFSGLDTPIAVATRIRPPWLAAVVREPGVVEATVATALARFARV